MDAVKKIVATDARRLKLEALTTLQQIAEGNVDIKYAPIARAPGKSGSRRNEIATPGHR
jgi:hypothetical protein